MKEPLEKFGAFFIQNLRDNMLYHLEMFLSGTKKSDETQELQRKISSFSDSEKLAIREIVEKIITSGMHDFLFAIQEESDCEGFVKVLVDGQEVAKMSDGLHGEIFGKAGWIVRFSKYPSVAEIERSKWAQEKIQEMFGKKD